MPTPEPPVSQMNDVLEDTVYSLWIFQENNFIISNIETGVDLPDDGDVIPTLDDNSRNSTNSNDVFMSFNLLDCL